MLTMSKKTKTVESITAGLSGMVSELNALAIARTADAEAAHAESARQLGIAADATAEADRASSAASKIGSLFS